MRVVLAVLVALAQADEDFLLICNGNSPLAKDLQRAVYAVHTPPLDDDCVSPSYETYLATLQTRLDGCNNPLLWIAPGAAIVCQNYAQRAFDDFRGRCDPQRARHADLVNLVNARMPLSEVPFFAGQTTVTMDHTFAGDPTSVESGAFAGLDRQRVLWTRLVLATQSKLGAAGRTCGTMTDCLNVHWLVGVPPSLLDTSLVVASNTLLLNQQGLAPDLVFDDGLAQSAFAPGGNLVRTSLPGSRNVGWGFVLRGCAVPNITVRVSWHYTEDAHPVGESVPASGGACWRRTLTVLSVSEYGGMQCSQDGVDTNALRARFAAMGGDRAAVLNFVRGQAWGLLSAGRWVGFSDAYAQALLTCAQPASGVGGRWTGFSRGDAYTPGMPGLCMGCALSATLGANMRTRSCNRSLAAERLSDCCFGCAAGYLMLSSSSVCVQNCARGTQPDGLGHCAACPSGKYSLGGQGLCAACSALGFGVNSYAGARGCVQCGTTAVVSSSSSGGGTCVACAAGLLVVPGTTLCTVCPAARYVPAGGSACVACMAGTYLELAGDTSCALCPPDTISATVGAASRATCAPCPVGQRAVANRTRCVPCDPINAATFPFLQYYQAGCAVRCTPGVSYLRTNVYSPGGCASCAGVVAPTGAYIDGAACNVARPCTNAPAANAHYVNGSAVVNRSLCGWACNVGYYEPTAMTTCVACAYPAWYRPGTLHRPTTGCAFTCVPYRYVDAQLACNRSCIALLGEVQAGRIATRVSTYVAQNLSRPRYVQGVCGTTETVPTSPVPFLWRGAYAFTGSGSGTNCGNALLDVGEACDDGNTAAGDGCSPACAVETDRYWDCDLIGVPCLPNCGWQVQQTLGSAWTIGLRQPWGGYVMPACAGGRCSCTAGLTYYGVTQQVALADLGAWMAAHLVPCDCGGNAGRMLPYSNCTVANRGCRACAPTGEYHDDLRAKCAACGSDCAPGYTAGGQLCGAWVSTSTLNNGSAAAYQAAIGCVPCTARSVAVRYVQGCSVACVPGVTYCQSLPSSSDDATCPGGACASCALALAGFLLSVPPPGAAGYYPEGCTDGVGYAWRPCDALPAHAHWTSNSRTPGDSRGCGWACDAGTLTWGGVCLPCFAGASACVSGQIAQPCGGSGLFACQPCVGTLPNGELQVWASDPPHFAQCRADCEPGVSWSPSLNGSGVQCSACTRVTCALGTMRMACTTRSDATCVACALVPPSAGGGALPANAEYVAAGACATRCQVRVEAFCFLISRVGAL